MLYGQIISGATGRVNAGFSKRILNNKGSAKLNFRDIFRTGLNHGVITSIKGAYATYHNRGDTRVFTISFSYNFGKTTNSPRARNSGAEAEQNRVKN
ncbi:MAG: outer membrane beta-barrel protein [Chitinophagaceae bacterium]